MRTVTAASVAAGEERIEGLPESVMEALGDLAGAAKEGLLALSVGVGLGVLHELMEAWVDEVVGPKGRHVPDRTAVLHGHEGGEVTLGGRRVPFSLPRARMADDEREVELATYAHFAGPVPVIAHCGTRRPAASSAPGRRLRKRVDLGLRPVGAAALH